MPAIKNHTIFIDLAQVCLKAQLQVMDAIHNLAHRAESHIQQRHPKYLQI
jgi:hypothetical protein